MRVCGFVWELWMWRTISCQWGYPYTALVEQALLRVSSNPMQLIHTKTSLNLPLNTTGKRLSASIVGGRKRPPLWGKVETFYAIHPRNKSDSNIFRDWIIPLEQDQ